MAMLIIVVIDNNSNSGMSNNSSSGVVVVVVVVFVTGVARVERSPIASVLRRAEKASFSHGSASLEMHRG